MSASLAFSPNFNAAAAQERLNQRRYSNQNRFPSTMIPKGNPEYLNDPNDVYFDKRSQMSIKSPSINSNMSQQRPRYINQTSLDLVSPGNARKNSLSSNGYINNDPGRFADPGNSTDIIPMVTKSSTNPKPFSGVSKLLQSMRRGKSQNNLNQLGSTRDLNKSQTDLKASSLNLGSKFNLFSGGGDSGAVNQTVTIIHLDGQEQVMKVNKSNCIGSEIFNSACVHVNILEVDYFGITYQKASSIWFWLDTEKRVSKQLDNNNEWKFFFQVKFYPPEPSLLLEDITRFNLLLQIRQDIASGKLPCSWVTQALLGSYLLQSELGDYNEANEISLAELRSFQFVKTANEPLLKKIIELHKSHVGLKPSQAHLKYLETAKRLERYGIDLHPARDMDKIMIDIGVGYQGILIYRDKRRIGRFAWPKVLQLSYEKNDFFLTIRPDDIDSVETKIGFHLHNAQLAKRLWMSAVDHHSFFRLKQPQQNSKRLTLARNFGSQHHLSGRTFHQNRTMTINRPNPNFDRSLLRKKTASMPMGLDMDNQQPGKSIGGHGMDGSEMNSYTQDSRRHQNFHPDYRNPHRDDPDRLNSPLYHNDGLEDGSYIGGGSMMSGLSENRKNTNHDHRRYRNPNETFTDPKIRREDINYVNNDQNRNPPKNPIYSQPKRPSTNNRYNNYHNDDEPNYL